MGRDPGDFRGRSLARAGEPDAALLEKGAQEENGKPLPNQKGEPQVGPSLTSPLTLSPSTQSRWDGAGPRDLQREKHRGELVAGRSALEGQAG